MVPDQAIYLHYLTLLFSFTAKQWTIWLLMNSVLTIEGAITNWGRSFHTGPLWKLDDRLDMIIVTLSSFTRVTVTGYLPTKPYEQQLTVSRDQPGYLELPWEYLRIETDFDNWKTEMRGLTIISQDEDIGVRLVSSSDNYNTSGAITVMPDNALGTEYRLFAGAIFWMQFSLFGIIATEDGTTVTLVWNDDQLQFDLKDQVTINGNALTGDELDITLNENEILYMACNNSPCYQVVAKSDKNIALIGGSLGKLSLGHVIIQLVPYKFFGTDFVLPPTGGNPLGMNTLTVTTRSFMTNVICTSNKTAGMCQDGVPFDVCECSDTGRHVLTTDPVMIYNHIIPFDLGINLGIDLGLDLEFDLKIDCGGCLYRPTGFPLANVQQFSTSQVIYMEEGHTYHVTVITTSGNLAGIAIRMSPSISFNFTFQTLCQDPLFAERTATIEKATHTSDEMQAYYNIKDFVVVDRDPTDNQEHGIVEFRAAAPNKPILVIATEVDESLKDTNTAPAFGLKYVEWLDPSTCSRSETVPDDEVDNDCDGRVDEELNNGIDDDDDGLIDEDLAAEYPNGCSNDIVDNPINATRTTPTTACSATVTVGDTVTYVCNAGTSKTSGDLVRTCNFGFTLSGSAPKCEPWTPIFEKLYQSRGKQEM